MKITHYSSFYIAYCLNIEHGKFKTILDIFYDLFNIGYEVQYNFDLEEVEFILNIDQFEHLTKIMNHFNNIFKILGE